MDRPGLKQLLADVAAGKVDVIVLYNVDRFTRSLADVACIVEVLRGGRGLVRVDHPVMQQAQRRALDFVPQLEEAA